MRSDGVIRESFSFHGTLGRRDFLVRLFSLGLALFFMMLAVVAVGKILEAILWTSPAAAPTGFRLMEVVVVVAVTLAPSTFAFYALAAKRLRSIGLDPAVVLLVSIGLGFYEKSLFEPAFGQAQLLGYWASPVGHIWDLLFLMVLCLWPQRSSPEPSVPARTFAWRPISSARPRS